MRKEEWNEGLNHVDPALVEAYVAQKEKLGQRNRQRSLWTRIGALAACLALIVSAIIIIPRLGEDDAGTIMPPAPDPYTPIRFDATVSPENLYGSSLEFVVGSSLSGGGGGSYAPPEFRFSTTHYGDFAVKARVVENYPDVYYQLDVSSEYAPDTYRLVLMETLEVLNGEDVPRYFLYLISNYTFVDMSVYDSLLISMTQLGTENYVLRNGTQNKMEAVAFPVFSDRQGHPELGNIIAFRDGVFDESLWQTHSWLYGYQFAKWELDNPDLAWRDLVVHRGDSEQTVIEEIQRRFQASRETPFGSSQKEKKFVALQFSNPEAKAALEYVKPFANGVFSQGFINKQIVFRRYINGCQTEETVTIDLETEEVTYSEVRYTQEDLSDMENISVHLAEMAQTYVEQTPTPPHTDPAGKKLICLNLYAWYAKVDGKMYGVLKTSWRYKEEDDWYVQYHDESYILYDMEAGTATDISREDLIEIVGTRNVYQREFGVPIHMPM